MTIVATAGHVDHGKSSLVLALTGMQTDRLPEEAERGLTVDLGFAHLDVGNGVELSFIDVPGHVRFIRNMLAGVGATEVVLLVVAADDGWMPQTEEHLSILELLGVRHGVVAVTKVDLVTDDRLAEVRSHLARRLAGSALSDAPVVEVAAPTGHGLAGLRSALQAVAARTDAPPDADRARLWIDRTFSLRGTGTVVTGTLTGGSISVGADLEVRPGGALGKVRGLQHHGLDRDCIGPGRRAAINIPHLDLHGSGRGRALVRPGRWHQTHVVDASMSVLASAAAPVGRRGAHLVYIGTGEWTVAVRVLGRDVIEPGGHGLVRLHLPRPLPVLPGDRYVVRDAGRASTVAGGEILDIAPVLPAARARPDRSVDRVVAEHGWIAADRLELLTGGQRPPTVGRWVAAPDALRDTVESLASRVGAASLVGLELAALAEHERAVVDAGLVPGTEVVAGHLRAAGNDDPVIDHPWLVAAAATPFDPPPVDDVDPDVIRHLARRGLVVRRDGLVFHADAVDRAAALVADLLVEHPEGITVSQVRDAFASSRRCTLPLLAELDARGITRRTGSVRVAGPRLGRTPAG